MSYYKSAEESYKKTQETFKELHNFYSSFNPKDKEAILYYSQEDFKNFLKNIKAKKTEVFVSAINQNGELFIENCAAKLIYAIASENAKKIKFYDDCFKIAVKKTPVELINKRYQSMLHSDMFKHTMIAANNSLNPAYFITLLNHFPHAFLANPERESFIFTTYSDMIFKNKELFDFLNNSIYARGFYPEHRQKFDSILSSFIECQENYSVDEIYNFLKNISEQSHSFIEEIYDDEEGPVGILLNYFDENKSESKSKIATVIQKLVINDDLIITSEEEKHSLVKLVRENVLLKNLLTNSSEEMESKVRVKRI